MAAKQRDVHGRGGQSKPTRSRKAKSQPFSSVRFDKDQKAKIEGLIDSPGEVLDEIGQLLEEGKAMSFKLDHFTDSFQVVVYDVEVPYESRMNHVVRGDSLEYALAGVALAKREVFDQVSWELDMIE